MLLVTWLVGSLCFGFGYETAFAEDRPVVVGVRALRLRFTEGSKDLRSADSSDSTKASRSGTLMYPRRINKRSAERLIELAVEGGEDRASFVARWTSSGLNRQDAPLLFAWYREMAEMADHNDLLLAASVQYDELAVKLLSNGADPNSRTSDGTTALMYASLLGDVVLVRALLTAEDERWVFRFASCGNPRRP